MNQISSFIGNTYDQLISLLNEKIQKIKNMVDQNDTFPVDLRKTQTELNTLSEQQDFMVFVVLLVENSKKNTMDWHNYVADLNMDFFRQNLDEFARRIGFSVRQEFRSIKDYIEQTKRIFENKRVYRPLSINRRTLKKTMSAVLNVVLNSEDILIDFLRDISRTNRNDIIRNVQIIAANAPVQNPMNFIPNPMNDVNLVRPF